MTWLFHSAFTMRAYHTTPYPAGYFATTGAQLEYIQPNRGNYYVKHYASFSCFASYGFNTG